MKEIRLTQGMVALVDDEDYELLNRFNWYAHKDGKTFYAAYARKEAPHEKRITVQMHRLIMGMSFGDGRLCDHINRNGLDNRKNNLRETTKAVNGQNCRLHKNNSSGYTGVRWQKSTKTWVAYKRIGGVPKYLGTYTDPYVAHLAYERGERVTT